jgi:glycosyltransferase involved in cell wall biosynthesis
MPKVLIITYYWPPAGGPGVQRTLKFCKFLLQFGWQPIILTVNNGNFPALDQTLLAEVPTAIKIYKSYSLHPFAFYNILKGKKLKSGINTLELSKGKRDKFSHKFFKWCRANLFIPDARLGWLPFLIYKGNKIIKTQKPDLIFSSSPPHSLQIGAALISKKGNIPLISDLRDPWTEAFWLKNLPRNTLSWLIDKKIEKLTLNQARCITTVSKGLKDIFSQITNSPVQVIYNGFDADDFCNITKVKNKKFTICHTGNIRTAQFATAFFDSIDNLPDSILCSLEIHLYGNVHSEIKEYIARSKAAHCYYMPGYIDHSLVIKKIINADLLLVFSTNTPNSKGVLTAKLFEYIKTGNHIIAYAAPGNEIAEILTQTETGSFFTFDEPCQKLIEDIFRLWQTDSLPSYGNSKVDYYSRKNQTGQLVQIFESKI